MEFAVDGLRTFAATGGRPFDPARPAILFVHGAANDHSVWHLPARHFAHHGYSVAAIDLPGHGRSEGEPPATVAEMAGWVGRARAALGLERAVLAGHSMGSLIVLCAAADDPAATGKLILLGPAAAMPVHDDLLDAARRNDHKAIDLITYWGLSAASQIGGHRSPGLWMNGGGQRLLERADDGVLAAGLAACAAFADGEALARAIEAETLLILGERDMMTPMKGGVALARAIPDARHVVLAGCGHMMLAERPNETLDAMRDFLLPAAL